MCVCLCVVSSKRVLRLLVFTRNRLRSVLMLVRAHVRVHVRVHIHASMPQPYLRVFTCVFSCAAVVRSESHLPNEVICMLRPCSRAHTCCLSHSCHILLASHHGMACLTWSICSCSRVNVADTVDVHLFATESNLSTGLIG